MSLTDSNITTQQGTAADTAPESIIGKKTGQESALSNWVGPYVTEMLGRGQAVSSKPFEAYMGPLTAGESAPQTAAFQGIANLAVPTEQMTAFTPQTFGTEQATQYMNPYVQNALQPQLDELNRQQQLKRVDNASRLSRAGAYGGGRQAVMESELDRSYLDKASEITGLGYLDAYNKAQQQFNAEQNLAMQAQNQTNVYGLNALQRQADLGGQQRGIEAEGIAADKEQFDFEYRFPYKQVQFQQSLLQGLPLAAQSYNYAQPSALANILSGAAGSQGLATSILGEGGIGGLISGLFGGGDTGGFNTAATNATSDYFGFGDTDAIFDPF
tara:strand:- start:763 stop:1746 length:984 start_codon:yes stop_codon:yes gene_type:complete